MAEEKKTTAKKDAPAKEAAPKKKKFTNPFSFEDPLQAKLINCIMKNGKKTVAVTILKDAFAIMDKKGEVDVMKTFDDAFKNVTPNIEVKAKRIGGAVYQIPIEVEPKRQLSLSIRWVLAGARSKKGRPMAECLANELIDAANERGVAFGRKEDMHRMAQANKAFAHLARY